MARTGKWLKGVSPEGPVEVVARRALEERLERAWSFLRQASRGLPDDLASVHQLRVGARRAVAALKLFESLLPGRRAKWMLRQLKRVRRAAGAARDVDVLLERFATPVDGALIDAAHAAMIAHLRRLRREAQPPIEAIHAKLARKDFPRRTAQLLRRVKLRTADDRHNRPTFAETARQALGPRVLAFFAASEVDFRDDALLHAFRIRGKQLRYAMEVFAGAFDPTFKRELYPLVAELQNRLGQINDHATASARFAAWAADPDCDDVLRPLFRALADRERQSLEACRATFVAWWSPDRREDLRQRFAAVGYSAASSSQTADSMASRSACSENGLRR